MKTFNIYFYFFGRIIKLKFTKLQNENLNLIQLITIQDNFHNLD